VPEEREKILQELKRTEARLTERLNEVTSDHGRALAHLADHDDQIQEIKSQVSQLREQLIETKEWKQAARDQREEFRQLRATLDRYMGNELSQERLIADLRVDMTKKAHEAGAEAGTEAGLLVARSGKTWSAIAAFAISTLMLGAWQGCQAIQSQMQPH
jgi:chromosome segregation ATPase